MTDLLKGKGLKALFIYKILPFVLLSIGLFFVNTQGIRFVFIGFFMITCIMFVIIYPTKAYIGNNKLFYRKTFGSEQFIDLASIKDLTPQYRKRFGWTYTIIVRHGNNKKLELLGLADKNRAFMGNVNNIPPFYIMEELQKALRQQKLSTTSN